VIQSILIGLKTPDIIAPATLMSEQRRPVAAVFAAIERHGPHLDREREI
jgi:hypothetical protein